MSIARRFYEKIIQETGSMIPKAYQELISK